MLEFKCKDIQLLSEYISNTNLQNVIIVVTKKKFYVADLPAKGHTHLTIKTSDSNVLFLEERATNRITL